MADKTFRQVILDAADEADLNLRERVKLRIVLRRKPDLLADEIFNQAQVEGRIPLSAKINDPVGVGDWEALAKFIKEILPVILQIISLFT